MQQAAPEYQAIRQSIMVSMRDGVRLATDVYLPHDRSEPVPVILERTPYDRQGLSRSERSYANPEPMMRPAIAEFFARNGFAVVMQDCRGRYGSEGLFTKYLAEGEDGFDTLEWIASQEWCDGRVATMGLSYGAHTQLAMACLAPPALACMFLDSGGFANAYQGGIRRGGAFELKQVTWAHRHALLSPETLQDPEREAALRKSDIRQWFRNMPWSPGHSPLAAAPEYEAYLFEQWQAGMFTAYWQQPGLYAEGFYDQFPDVPTAIVGSWYDPYVLSCTRNFVELSRRKQSPVSLLMGPWTHGDRSLSYAGDVDFGPSAILDGNIATDYRQLRLDWFNRCLRGQAANEVTRPGVTYFEMGGADGRRLPSGRMLHGGQWRHSTCWPPQDAVATSYYLHPEGHLRIAPPAEDGAYLQYRYDPADPVPTIGGALASGQPIMQEGAFDQRISDKVFLYKGAATDTPLALRPDVLVFSTPPLEHDLVVTGMLQAELWVSSDSADTDFTVKLIDWYPPCDDYPDGYAMNITDGIFRVRYRDGWDRESFLQPDMVYRILIEPFATSNRFQKGHRLRIDISSSNYPHFDINPNTAAPVGQAGPAVVANNRIWCCARYPSQIHLPIMRD